MRSAGTTESARAPDQRFECYGARADVRRSPESGLAPCRVRSRAGASSCKAEANKYDRVPRAPRRRADPTDGRLRSPSTIASCQSLRSRAPQLLFRCLGKAKRVPGPEHSIGPERDAVKAHGALGHLRRFALADAGEVALRR